MKMRLARFCVPAVLLLFRIGAFGQDGGTLATTSPDTSALNAGSGTVEQPKAGPPEQNRSAPVPARPLIQFPFLRQDEDWTFLADPAKRTDAWDRLKYIPLGCEACYLTLGGEERAVYEYYDNSNWGGGPQTNSGFVTQRYYLTSDFHFGSHFRFFGELGSSLEDGRNGGPRPYDEDRADVHQGFFDVNFHVGDNQAVTLRAGRQELFYGSGRLVEAREGLNTRITWDGALARWQAGHWRIDGFAVRPVNLKPGAFDDTPDHTRQFWGVYASGPLTKIQNLDVYYFGLDQKLAAFDKGAGRQVRQTFGARWWGTANRWDFDDEAIGQLGTFGSGDIRAWAMATDHGYTLRKWKRSPRFGLRADVASGDNDPNGHNLGTFSPLFPKGKYFGEADLNGPSNTIDALPNVGFNLAPKLRCTAFYGAFWRESIHDGVYGFATNLERSGLVSTARFVGQQAEVDLDFPINAHALARVAYQHFFPGEFLKQDPPGKNVNYVTVWWVYRF